MRQAIGSLVLFCAAVVFKGGDIDWRLLMRPTAASFDSAASSFPARDSPAPASEKTSWPRYSDGGIPLEFKNNPLHFLSTAPVDSLVLLPGIGPVLAERIAGVRTGKRSFTKWDDLLAVKGIGPKTLDRLKKLE
jgi:hypothetical protein